MPRATRATRNTRQIKQRAGSNPAAESSPKRRRTDAGVVDVDDEVSSECVTFETLAEREYPVDLISERLVRLLVFEREEGIREIALLALRIAGSTVELPPLRESDLTVAAAEIADQAESGAETSVQAEFALQKPPFAHQFGKLWAHAVPALLAADGASSLNAALHLLCGLTKARLRTLRHAATQLVAEIGVCWHGEATVDQPVPAIVEATMDSRTGDIVPAVREIAVETLGTLGQSTARSLNDMSATVRLAALNTLSANAPWTRVAEMALRDVDVRVRRRALRQLATGDISVSNSSTYSSVDRLHTGLVCLVQAEDDSATRLAAAELVVHAVDPTDYETFEKHGLDAAWSRILRLAELPARILGTYGPSASALAKAAGRVKISASQVSALMLCDIASLRAPNNASRTWLRRLETRVGAALPALLVLFKALVAIDRNPKDIVAVAESLLGRVAYSDALTASMIQALSLVTPTDEGLFELAISTFTERPERRIAEACASLFARQPEEIRSARLESVVQDVKIALATALGPGARNAPSPDIVGPVLQLQILSRFVPLTGLTRLPIWDCEQTRPLVRALGLTGDEEVVDMIISRLRRLEPVPAPLLLEIRTAAAMRGLTSGSDMDLDSEAPEWREVPDRTWRAAVAAGVV